MRKTVLFECPDISSYQGAVEFKRMRDAGYPAVILRAGWGQNNRDERYARNAEACVNLGIPAAVYWFSYALDDQSVLREAEYAIAAAKEYWKNAPIAYDLEYDTRRYAATKGINMDKDMCTRHAVMFLRAVKAAGHKPILYTNRDYWRNYFDVDLICKEVGDVSIWFAYYSGSEPSEVEKSAMWQYASKGSITGIAGKCDVNRVYEDIFRENCTSFPANPAVNLYIKSFQTAANLDGYRDQNGKSLDEDGMDGPKTQFVRRKIFLRAQKTVLSYKAGSKGAVVKWWQLRCNEILGHDQEVDGLYGKISRSETMALQRKLGLAVDGIAGYNSIQAAFYN